MKKPYHYTECGLDTIYLTNGFSFVKTARGQAVSISNIDGLHKAIGTYLVKHTKDLSGAEIRFLRLEMLLSQADLARLLGVSEQAIRRWEREKISIPKPSESLLRLIYSDFTHRDENKIIHMLKKFALIDEPGNKKVIFKDTSKGWRLAA